MSEPVSIAVELVEHTETEVQLIAALESVMQHFEGTTSAAEKERASRWIADRYATY